MIWNYRILRHTDPVFPDWYAIHEVYYDANRTPTACTEPIDVVGDDPEDVRAILRMMLEDSDLPVLDYDSIVIDGPDDVSEG